MLFFMCIKQIKHDTNKNFISTPDILIMNKMFVKYNQTSPLNIKIAQ